MSALLSIQGLSKTFGGRRLLDIDHLEIAPATAYVLTGMNGSGKSTLLRILSGLEPASAGQIRFNGTSVKLKPYPASMRDAIVYVHQHPVMFGTSVIANIGYGLRVRGQSRQAVAHRVEQAMEWAGLSHLRNHRPATLSGGEKQRVALARANILAPRLLLLDEPTANLDGDARHQVMALIPRLVSEGVSLIMACHDRDLISMPGVHRLELRDARIQHCP